MSGTSLDGIDVVLATITENMVAQQASLTWPIPRDKRRDSGDLPGAVADPFAAKVVWTPVWDGCLPMPYWR